MAAPFLGKVSFTWSLDDGTNLRVMLPDLNAV